MQPVKVPKETQEAMDRAKAGLMYASDTVFFTTVLFSLKHQWTEEIPTACTDGKSIMYNPDFFMKCSPEERVGLLLHETFHVVWMHMTRLLGRDPVKWNVATDFVINLLIRDRGFSLPSGALIDEKYRGMSADEVYDLLPQQNPQEVEIHFTEPGEGSDQDSEEAIEAHIQDVLIQAQIQSKKAGDAPGTIPGDIEMYLERLLKPKLPTANLLRKYLYDTNKDDYSWQFPNPRFMPEFYMPSLHSDSLGHIAVFVDASGSVRDDQFLRFVSEVGGIIRSMKPKLVSLITFDTGIREVREIKNMKDLTKASFTGRGGTQIKPVIDWCKQNNPKVALVFTDGHFRFFDQKPPANPMIWLINDNDHFKAPYGRVLNYES